MALDKLYLDRVMIACMAFDCMVGGVKMNS